jgi:hypothetical protein
MLLFEPNEGGRCLCVLLSSPCPRSEFHLECGRYE